MRKQLQFATHKMKLSTLLPAFLFITSSTSYPYGWGLPSHNKPVFTLTNITYTSEIIYSTPAHLAVANGRIEFNLTNSAVPYITHCNAESEWLYDFFYGNIVYTCDAPTGEGIAEDASANFTFSKPAGTFEVNQTWSELRQGYDHPAFMLFGTGSGNATMNCETSYWQNTNWTLGQLYSITTENCKPANLTITPTVFPLHK
ncbi:hypothetical protein AOQ84DRAFT_438252 [Glonium stellatum]|uniref:AA1-like domain-containing protein n=1 Tax=Glonium stellatum TaxID=574774 RepID=A0A8E2F524_9PEZI|nr:hypothetical protein AOQ84DRAFT_438252 [Glonium stellatum]